MGARMKNIVIVQDKQNPNVQHIYFVAGSKEQAIGFISFSSMASTSSNAELIKSLEYAYNRYFEHLVN